MQGILKIPVVLIDFENLTAGQVTKYLHTHRGMLKCLSSILGRLLLVTRGDVRFGLTILISKKLIHNPS